MAISKYLMDKNTTSKAERRLQLLQDKKIGWLFIFVGLLAFIAFVYSGREYNRTIIQFKYILLCSIIAGLTIGSLTLKYSRRTNGNSFNIWKHFLWASIIYGSLLCGLFFWTNIHLAKSNLSIIKTPILARFETFRYSHRYVTVNISDFEKDIPVPNIEMSEIKKSNFIVLTLNKGFWGFSFVVDKKLLIN